MRRISTRLRPLLISVFIVGAAATTISTSHLVHAEPGLTQADTSGPDILVDVAVATAEGPTELTVDFAQDPKRAAAFLARSQESLDGFVINIVGQESAASSERRARDVAATGDPKDVHVTTARTSWSCAAEYDAVETISAFVGCAEAKPLFELTRTLPRTFDNQSSRLDLALKRSYVAAANRAGIPVIPDLRFESTIQRGVASIDLRSSNSFARAGALTDEVTAWLTATALTAPDVATVSFSYNGSCTSFSLLSRGDECAPPITHFAFSNSVPSEVFRP